MKNRIDQKFDDLKLKKQKAFIAYITAGDPDLKTTEQLVYAFEQSGVDIIELGVPFSDPMADGPTIQAASQRALKNHVSLTDIFQLVHRIRKRSQIPIALMTYYNPVFHLTDEGFVQQAAESGVDGVIIPDLPPEEARDLRQSALHHHLSVVFFMAPTTTDERLSSIVKAATGFVYYVSLTGVTGARSQLSRSIAQDIKRAKKHTDKPVCVGFGISNASQVAEVGSFADGVIVGSAIVKQIEAHLTHPQLVSKVAQFVKSLVDALRKGTF